MNQFLIPFILATIAGLSTMLGVLLINIKYNQNKLTKFSLAFASGVMLSLSLLELTKESLILFLKTNNKNISFIYVSTAIIIGIILSIIIDKIIPTNKKANNKKLYKIGIISMIAIILHNIPEGVITFITNKENLNLGIKLTVAILLHNITEGISIAIPIYAATGNKNRAVIYTSISALAEPLGAILAFLFLSPIVTNNILGLLLALTAGIMLYIGLFKLLKEALQYNNKYNILLFFMLGIFLIIINNIII